ncbi:FHA domain-containing protein [Nannocystis sp.]|uniref:FHA domain-containing protein n=1 Tax=Nannocystis sp. TaxID=1962667 RepID=UPI0024251238|nr:FHA domain-containing protein [Nannocystis sp.]MBK7826389.1 FHA domain-containing protein [Nannocystis sp.]MBK9757905.1 FHA domain-containing protein [Nannocystis sp.]
MGVLRAQESGHTLQLPARCLIGRSRACDLVLGEPQVSSQHAALEWNGSKWEVCDLGSRNGTHVNGLRLAAGERVPIRRGAELRFGRESPAWLLADDGGPSLMAVQLATGESQLAAGGYLVLPDAERPEVAVYQDARGVWVAETRGEQASLEDRAVIAVANGAVWRVHLPSLGDGTLKENEPPLLIGMLLLRFSFTRDEEHVELRALHGERCLDLQARAYHYPLLLLARQRLADRAAGLAESEQGWIRQDELLKQLRIDENYLHISLHRARTQLGKLGVADVAGLVERRSGTRQLRLGVARLELVPLDAAQLAQ